MALKFLKKENAKLKFLYRQKRHLTSDFSRLLLIQPYFSYGSSSWFHLLKKNLKIKHEKAQKKKGKKSCSCVNLPLISHVNLLFSEL